MNDEPRIDTFRTLLLLLVAVLILDGAWAVGTRTMGIDAAYLRRRWDERPFPMIDRVGLTYVAARTLRLNHRLTADDLIRPVLPRSIAVDLPPDLIGRYARHQIAAGIPVHPNDVVERPAVAAEVGKALLTFPAEAALVESGGVDVETVVEIRNGTDPAATGTVKAITGSGATQRFVVSVMATEVAKILQKPKDAVTTIVPSIQRAPPV
jgi:hypothetical protein